MTHLSNTLFVSTQGAYITRDHETVRVKLEGKVVLTVPFHHLEGIVCFGRISVSPAVFAACGERQLWLSFMSEHGHFLARVESPVQGNVLLRRQQYRLADDPAQCLGIARPIIAAKIQNARNTLLRAARDNAEADDAEPLPCRDPSGGDDRAIANGAQSRRGSRHRGGNGPHIFRRLPALGPAAARFLRARWPEPAPAARPRQRNAVVRLRNHATRLRRALQAVGLDPAVGYLHADRPGRLSLALDLMEEFRSLIADRLVLTLINRRQVNPDGFQSDPAGGVTLDSATRRAVLVGYQERKREEVTHPLLGENVPVGLLPHIQARLLARTVRGEVSDYPAVVLR